MTTIDYKLVKTIESGKADKSKIKIGYFLIGRTHQDFYGLVWRCKKCEVLCSFPEFVIGDFLSDRIKPKFTCKSTKGCKEVKTFDSTEFKSVLYRIWSHDKLFDKNEVYIYKINNNVGGEIDEEQSG